MWRWAVVLAAVILGGIGAWVFTSTEEEIRVPAELAPAEVPPFNAPAAEPQPVEPAVSSDIIEPAPVVEEPSWVLPPLNQSDAFVREQLAALGAPARWSEQEELVRRFTVLLENGSRGEYPRRQLQAFPLAAPFGVTERDGRFYVDPVNYARYEGWLSALEAIDPVAAGRLLAFLEPLVDASLAELGTGATLRPLLAAGLRVVLDTPILTESEELIRPNVLYKYADPALESEPALARLLMRSGPSNVLRVQGWARRLAAAMAITPTAMRADG
ncbi:MAG TPA: hypothetical protein DCR65_08995 [Gammaproteobacteria bacterium]|jgi:hypothetical protein|nr:hypothetical protein [Gammaproteobacteria bacterium]